MNAVFMWQWKCFSLRPTGWLALLLASATCMGSLWWLIALLSREHLLALGTATDPVAQFLGPNLFVVGIVSLLAPLLTMNLFSNDHRRGTWELLVTSPVATSRIVLGKFLAAWGWLALCLAPWPAALLALHYFGGRARFLADELSIPAGTGLALDPGRVACGFLGLLVVAGLFAAVGTACSSLCRRPLAAALLTLMAAACMLLLATAPAVLALGNVAPGIIDRVEQLSCWKQVERTSHGQLPLRAMAAQLAILGGCLWLACLRIRPVGRARGAWGPAALAVLPWAGWFWLPAQVDMTVGRWNSLAPRTLELLSRINAPLEVEILEPRAPRLAAKHSSAQAAALLKPLVELMSQHNALVRCRTVDPAESRLAEGATGRTEEADVPAVVMTLFVEHGPRQEVLPAADLMAWNWAADSRAPVVQFRGEQLLAAALERLLERRAASAGYALTGHGELELEDHDPASSRGMGLLRNYLALQGCELRPLNLDTVQQVPPDADFLLIAGPREPLPPATAEKLEQYLHHGGRALVLLDLVLDPLRRRAVASGLEELLDKWGVRPGADRVVALNFAGVPERAVAGHWVNSTAGLWRNPPRLSVALLNARSVRIASLRADAQYQAWPLLVSAEAPGAWAETDLGAFEDPRFDAASDLPGPVCLAVAVHRQRGQAREPVALVVGNAELASNARLSAANGHGARQFLQEAARWLQRGPQGLADIPARTFPAYSPAAGAADLQAAAWKLSLCLLVLISAAGTTVWATRRQG